jgi:large subunit ribosomal protein L10
LNRDEKAALVEELRASLEPEGHVILAEYRGLTVEELTQLRRKVRSASGTMRVMKNTLVRRAVEGTEKDALKDLLTGPNALFYTKDDPVQIVKAVAGATREFEAMKIKGGMLEGKALSPQQILRISELPSRDELLAKTLGTLAAPLQGLVNVMQGVSRNLVYVLDAIRQAKAAGG